MVVFLKSVAIILLDKTYSKYPKRRENCWMKTVKTYAPFELNIEDIVWTIWFRSINVTGGFTSLVLFSILVTHLGQDFPDVTCDFCSYCIVDFLIIDLLFLCNLFLRYVLSFLYVLVLFQFPGANYFAHHWFIIRIYVIVLLNVSLLLCISVASFVCARYFMYCVVLFNLKLLILI